MDITYCKSKWEMWDDPLEEFLARTSGDGFGATELYLETVDQSPDEVARLHRSYDLVLVGQILSEGETPDEHIRSLERQFDYAAACAPILVNHHAGRDIFPFEDNVRIFERIIALGAEAGIPVVVETHRGRPTYSATETRRFLEALPDLRITADFSHWMVVHESDLKDQQETLELAISRSDHIHARVGYEEGPQVPDPRAPEWEGHVANHLRLWQQIIERRRSGGTGSLTITPEVGPPDYMHTHPFTREPVGDAWEMNVYMKDLLQKELGEGV